MHYTKTIIRHRASRHSACNEVSILCIKSTSNSSLLRAQTPVRRVNRNSSRPSQRPSCASWLPSCPSYSLSWRQHVRKCAEKSNLRANIAQDIPQDASIIPSNHLKTTKKNYKNLRFLKVFRYPAHVPKSPKNAPKTTPRPPKLS